METIQFETKILLEDIPLQWLSKIELYYPDLMGFPIVYVHCKKNGNRLFGFAASISYKSKDDKYCDAEVMFLGNVDLDSDKWAKDVICSELKERFGITGKFGLSEVVSACNGNKSYEQFFKRLWDHVSEVTGDYIPYGRFFEEIYSMVRFVSAWQPKTGRQSEMRMLYNFLSIFGEKVEIKGRWSFIEFYLLPSYDDLLERNLKEFPKFDRLLAAMEKTWNTYFTNSILLDGTEIRTMKRAWPQNKDSFIKFVSGPLERERCLTHEERFSLDRLVDAFNRHSWRAAFFIWCIMMVRFKDYRNWSKEFFVNFYVSKKGGAGISEKVVACFLQQGFGKQEVIPVDTWVQSFHQMVLGIKDKSEFLNSFSKMGKLERIIWLASQGRKTNMANFFNMLWCIRFGVTGNKELRGPNPISCYECSLRPSCPSYSKMMNKSILIKDIRSVHLQNGELPKSVTQFADNNMCSYACLTDNGVPKKIFELRGKRWRLTDEFSGYILQSHHRTRIRKDIVPIRELVNSLPPFMENEGNILVPEEE